MIFAINQFQTLQSLIYGKKFRKKINLAFRFLWGGGGVDKKSSLFIEPTHTHTHLYILLFN